LSNTPFAGNKAAHGTYSFTVYTPKLFHFDEVNTNQMQEAMPNGIDLKTYILQQFPSYTPASPKPQYFQLGEVLGCWLKDFHEWSATQTGLRAKVEENSEYAQQIKHMLNFQWMYDRIKEYPNILGGAADVLAKVEQMADAERRGWDKLQIIHGDFWTGKRVPISTTHTLSLRIVRTDSSR
jgi:hypothetical protein